MTYFGENPNQQVLEKAKEVLSNADLLIIAGTSLTVNLFIQKPVGATFAKLG